MPFYPDVKAHMSPSALDAWFNNRSMFMRSYFAGEKSPTTAAMKGGTRIHALIEGGMYAAQKVFSASEKEIYIDISKDRRFLGIPDGYEEVTFEPGKGFPLQVEFVDYKTGKENAWKEKLPSDLKMKATAWLVWKINGEPERVLGHIEYIPTEWDSVAKEVIPKIDATSELISYTYHAEDLRSFTQVILKAMDEVNEAYEKWLTSTDEFVSQDDMLAYVDLKKKKDEIEGKMKEIAERITDQLDFGGKTTISSPLGTFYITERETYKYPPTIKIDFGEHVLTLADAEEIEMAAKAAKKRYETENEPEAISRSMGFRAAKA